jgi:hypothetical protein
MTALAGCPIATAHLKTHTDAQAPPPDTPDQRPPAEPGMIPLTIPETKRLLAATAFGPPWLWVRVNCREHAFPLALLPGYDLGPTPLPRTHDARARAATRFPGFTAQVRRTGQLRRAYRERPEQKVSSISWCARRYMASSLAGSASSVVSESTTTRRPSGLTALRVLMPGTSPACDQ